MNVASNFALALIACTSESSAGLSTRSILFSTSTFGCLTSESLERIAPASSSMPFLASISSTTISASCAPHHAVVTIARSSRRRGAKMPGVSMKTSCASPCIAMPRITARVVCTLRLTMLTLEPTSELVSVDLPAFGAPISATKPQRRSGSAIRRIHAHAFARQHRRRGRLLCCTFGRTNPLGWLQRGYIHRDAELRIVMRSPALHLAIGRRRQAAALRPFLQHGLRVAQGTRGGEHTVAPQTLDQRRRRRIAAIDEYRTDQRLADIGECRHAAAAAGIRFRAAEPQCRTEIKRTCHIGAGLASHQIGEAARELALVSFGKCAVEHVGDRRTEGMVAEEFPPL